MKRQLLIAAAVLATGGTFGLTAPAEAHPVAVAHGYDRPPPPPRYEPHPADRKSVV